METEKKVIPMAKELRIDVYKRALEKACEKLSFCVSPPEYYNASSEYGSDSPVWITENECENDVSCCPNCRAYYFIKQAEEELQHSTEHTNNQLVKRADKE